MDNMNYYHLAIEDEFGLVTNYYGINFINQVNQGDFITNPSKPSELCEVKKIVHTTYGGENAVIFAKVTDQ